MGYFNPPMIFVLSSVNQRSHPRLVLLDPALLPIRPRGLLALPAQLAQTQGFCVEESCSAFRLLIPNPHMTLFV